jgi:phosphoribosyl-ATP pyrophosphohydrolase
MKDRGNPVKYKIDLTDYLNDFPDQRLSIDFDDVVNIIIDPFEIFFKDQPIAFFTTPTKYNFVNKFEGDLHYKIAKKINEENMEGVKAYTEGNSLIIEAYLDSRYSDIKFSEGLELKTTKLDEGFLPEGCRLIVTYIKTDTDLINPMPLTDGEQLLLSEYINTRKVDSSLVFIPAKPYHISYDYFYKIRPDYPEAEEDLKIIEKHIEEVFSGLMAPETFDSSDITKFIADLPFIKSLDHTNRLKSHKIPEGMYMVLKMSGHLEVD